MMEVIIYVTVALSVILAISVIGTIIGVELHEHLRERPLGRRYKVGTDGRR